MPDREDRRKRSHRPTRERPKEKAPVEDNQVRIKRLDMSRINTKKEGQRIGLIGMSGSGKSTVAVDIMKHNQNIPVWMVCSSSESRNHTYSPHLMNELTVHPDITADLLTRFKERQVKLCEKWQVPGTKPPQYYQDPSTGLILDDIADCDSKIFSHPVMKYLHCISRHDKVLLLELIQDYTFVPKKLRRSWSYVFLFRQNSIKELKIFFNEFGGMFDSFTQFKTVYDLCTADFGCMVIDALNPSNRIQDRVFYYRAAKDQPPFVCGQDWSKRQLQELYDPTWKDREDTTIDAPPPPITKRKRRADPSVPTKRATKRGKPQIEISLDEG